MSKEGVKHNVEHPAPTRRGTVTVNKKKEEGGNLTPFTTLTAKKAQEAATRARNLRKAMRARILQAAVDEGIDKMFIQAMKNSDTDRMKIVESAMRLTGLDFGSSEEAVQKVDLKADATLNGKVDSKLELVFKDLQPNKEA